MAMLYGILILLVAHFVGDFVLQFEKMATLKRKSLFWLSFHVSVYTATLFLFCLFLMDVRMAAIYAILNGIAHWIVDFFTSKINFKLSQHPKKHAFYIGLGFDQLIHQCTLIAGYLNIGLLELAF